MVIMEMLLVLLAVATAQGLPSCSTYCKAILSGIPVRWRSDCDCSLGQVTYEPNDTSIFYKPASHQTKSDTPRVKSEFLIINPATKQLAKNSTVSNNLNRKAETKILSLQTKEKPKLYRFTTKLPITYFTPRPDIKNVSYFDIDFNIVNEIRNNIKYSPKYYGLLERNITECVELHIIKFIRNCNTTDIPSNFQYKIDDNIDYTDEELKTEIDNKCKEIADIVEKSIKEIKEKWTKKKPPTEYKESTLKSQLAGELQTDLSTETNPDLNEAKIYLNAFTNTESNTAHTQLYPKTVSDINTNAEKNTRPTAIHPEIPVYPLTNAETNTMPSQSNPITESNDITIEAPNTDSLKPNDKKDTDLPAMTENNTVPSLKSSNRQNGYINDLVPETLGPTTLIPLNLTLKPKFIDVLEDVTGDNDNALNKYRNGKKNFILSLIPKEQKTNISETKQSHPFLPISFTAVSVPKVLKNHTAELYLLVKPEETTERDLGTETVTMDGDYTVNLKANEKKTESDLNSPQIIKKLQSSDILFTIPDYFNVQKSYNEELNKSTVGVKEEINKDSDKNQNRPTIEEKDVPVIRIISREYPNGTVLSEINGTELLPNNDFRNAEAETNLLMKNMKINNTPKYSEKIYHFIILRSKVNGTTKEKESSKSDPPEDITGRLYFLFKNLQMPARFVQDPDGTFKIGIDAYRYCEEIAENEENLTILNTLCKCIHANEPNLKSNS